MRRPIMNALSRPNTSYCVLQGLRGARSSDWVMVVMVIDGSPIISDLAEYISCWQAVCVNLLSTGGLFEVCLLGPIIPAHAACYFLFMEVVNALLFNWTSAAIILFGIHALGVLIIATYWQHKYIPKRDRGWTPARRCLTKIWGSLQRIATCRRCLPCWDKVVILPKISNSLQGIRHAERRMAISYSLSQRVSSVYLKMTSVLLLVQASIGISVAVSNPAFALQHIMFCL
jgi:hypothetical protein